MTLSIQAPPTESELKPRLVVIGVGGAGGNAVNNMIDSGLEGIEFIVANTDAQAMRHTKAERKIQLGSALTKGLGAGGNPEVGRQAALESTEEIRDQIQGAHMLFIAAGMGGGTGTGAASVVAEIAREEEILTVGVVTKPFQFEGSKRAKAAEEGIESLQDFIDTLIIIPNHNLFRVANNQTTLTEAFRMADEVLLTGVRGITDLMVLPGLMNLDFADVRTVMQEMGRAMMGTGEAEGEGRALQAAESAIANPLLEDSSLRGAGSLLVSISGGEDFGLHELNEAAERIREEVGDENANIIIGSSMDSALNGKLRVTVIATGIDKDRDEMERIAEKQRERINQQATPFQRSKPETQIETKQETVSQAKVEVQETATQPSVDEATETSTNAFVAPVPNLNMDTNNEEESEEAFNVADEPAPSQEDLFKQRNPGQVPGVQVEEEVEVEENMEIEEEEPHTPVLQAEKEEESFIPPEPVTNDKEGKSWFSNLSNPLGRASANKNEPPETDFEAPYEEDMEPDDAFLNQLDRHEQTVNETPQEDQEQEDGDNEDGVDEDFLSIPTFLRRQMS